MLSSMINADYKGSNYCRKNAVFEKCYVISTCYSAIDDTIYNHLPGDYLWKLQFVYFLWSAYIIKKQRFNYTNEISLSLHWCFHTLSCASSEQTLHLIYHSKQKTERILFIRKMCKYSYHSNIQNIWECLI